MFRSGNGTTRQNWVLGEWEQPCPPSCWDVLSSELCVSKVCPCPSGSQPWDPAWCSQRASTACFLGESGHTLCCTWQNDTFRGCRFSFYTYFISGGGQEFLSHIPQQHVGLAESKPGPPWGSQVWAFASGLVTQNWLWLTKVSPEVGIWKETFVHCGGITTEFYLITCQAN